MAGVLATCPVGIHQILEIGSTLLLRNQYKPKGGGRQGGGEGLMHVVGGGGGGLKNTWQGKSIKQ